MSLDGLPVWGVFLATIGLVALTLETGFYLGRRRQRLGGGKSEMSGAMVGAILGLLSFMLAFTFNGAAGRHETRKGLVIKEASAIDEAWLRAGFLEEPYRTDTRGLLRNYVELRVNAAAGRVDLEEAVHQSEALHDSIWVLVEEVGRKYAGAITTGLFIQSVNEVIDLHLERVTVGIRNRVPATTWAALYLLLAVGMGMIGTLIGLSGTRHVVVELALAIAFSVVLLLIADLDRPQEGVITVSQQAMEELQSRLNHR